MRYISSIILASFLLLHFSLKAQQDSPQRTRLLIKKNDTLAVIIPDTTKPNVSLSADTIVKSDLKDSASILRHDPRKATLRSALIPGWGQAYNREYWKIPIVYGALAIPAATYWYNNKWYKKTREAYSLVVSQDTGNYNKIDPKLRFLENDPESLQYYRNQFRKNRDYSILYFLVVWGLNVADATVFGHLKDFDVTDDLSMHVQPNFNMVTKKPELGLAFSFKNSSSKPLPAFLQ